PHRHVRTFPTRRSSDLKVTDDVLETFQRTCRHLAENDVDLEKSKLTLGPLLRLDSDKEKFADHPVADALLTREYRKPFVLPTAKDRKSTRLNSSHRTIS